MNIKKEIGIGMSIALVCTLAGMYIYVFLFTNYDLPTAIQFAYRDEFLGGLIAIGAAANFLPFFVYLKRDKIYRARGVLMFSILLVILILLLKIRVFV
ncbi:hypothetical protein [Mesohalobacter halotolerans]|uniref:Uncharacterized protein n=1 Tax=Mesohalobacter halotolerans TaxID=1883405 RepID=A0A4U5TT93_9FLAO|nr:hypothetical protein [Mesohalobacter halotolerans]MBS3738407.1 hypothetical protein [Psychroflexus sp.]TKS57353.1 hypothetical protein FCN74_02725 [Mesohalobacter halotolerans]